VNRAAGKSATDVPHSDPTPGSPEQENPHNDQVSNIHFTLAPRNSVPLTQTAADQGQGPPRDGEGGDGTATPPPPKRQKVSRRPENVQPTARHSARVPRLTERAKEAW
jgi:hypothetical protein